MSLKRVTLLLLFILLLGSSWSAWSRPLSFAEYDEQIRDASKLYWGDFPDWKFWKAQLFQESAFDPDAASAVGAQGLAQFMPASWADITKQLGLTGIPPTHAKYAIEAGAYYMAKLRHSWNSPRPEFDRHELAMASYNAGLGSLIKAQAACHNASLYADIAPCLPSITGSLASQTLTYVQNIQRWRLQLK